jgi:hypothetical protein
MKNICKIWEVKIKFAPTCITYNVIYRRVRVTIVALGKQQVLHILSVSVALVIKHAKRMRHIILSPVACLVLPYSSKLSHKPHDFRKKN